MPLFMPHPRDLLSKAFQARLVGWHIHPRHLIENVTPNDLAMPITVLCRGLPVFLSKRTIERSKRGEPDIVGD